MSQQEIVHLPEGSLPGCGFGAFGGELGVWVGRPRNEPGVSGDRVQLGAGRCLGPVRNGAWVLLGIASAPHGSRLDPGFCPFLRIH